MITTDVINIKTIENCKRKHLSEFCIGFLIVNGFFLKLLYKKVTMYILVTDKEKCCYKSQQSCKLACILHPSVFNKQFQYCRVTINVHLRQASPYILCSFEGIRCLFLQLVCDIDQKWRRHDHKRHELFSSRFLTKRQGLMAKQL